MLFMQSAITDKIEKLKNILEQAETVIIGASAGLSTAAGFTYNGERFTLYFKDFAEKYGFQDMYTGGFFPYETLQEYWAYWSRYIYINRYMNPPKPVYQKLYKLVKDKDYFVITTNVDHCFQKTGFDKKRIYYTQGDYGLFQCSKPCHKETYDNEEIIYEMVKAQGYQIRTDGSLYLPEGKTSKMLVPEELIPYCPKCKQPMSMNLRADNTFVEDKGWYQAAKQYEVFLKLHQNTNVLFLELGVGYNTPVIIKFVFHDAVRKNKSANYICVNLFQATAPEDIQDRSICIAADCGKVIQDLLIMNKNK